jgi:hypothetical protein
MLTKFYAFILFVFLIGVKTVAAQTLVWTSEAENGALLGGANLRTACSNASGGNFVQVGSTTGSGAKFISVNTPEDGDYKLYVNYFNDANQSMELFINDKSAGTISFPVSNFCFQGPARQVEIPVNLTKGINSISLMVLNNTGAPFLDKLSLYSVSPVNFTPTNYYISSSSGNDSNNGTSAGKPFKSLDKISAQILHPGDSVLFKATDIFIGQFDVTGSGSPSKMIYIGKYGAGKNPLINGSTANGGDNLCPILINNHDYIEIANLEIINDRLVAKTGVSNDLSYGIYVLNNGNKVMRNYRFHDLNIHDIYAPTTNPVFDEIKVAGIAFFTARNTEVGKEKNIRDVIVENCYMAHTTRFGIHVSHGGSTAGLGNDSLNRNMDMIFRKNHFFETGGSGILMASVYNGLLEHNIFEYSGSDYDPRMAKRGSGAWYFASQNVISQFNKSLHVRGSNDSYGQHIDFGNKNIILQYNYSEDSEGGFVEILGNNINSTYRFNVSVNDGFRNTNGHTIWISDYAGTNRDITSDSSYVYNNSVYVNAAITPDISITTKNAYVYNNIFYATGQGKIATQQIIAIDAGSALYMSNNLFFGNVNTQFSKKDVKPITGDPFYSNPGGKNIESYRLKVGSKALNAGIRFPEPKFLMAGKGIFKDIKMSPNLDLYGNPVSVTTLVPNIGAYNGPALTTTSLTDFKVIDATTMQIYPNPINQYVNIAINAKTRGEVNIRLNDLQGRTLNVQKNSISKGVNNIQISVDPSISNGIYLLSIEENGNYISKKIVIVR